MPTAVELIRSTSEELNQRAGEVKTEFNQVAYDKFAGRDKLTPVRTTGKHTAPNIKVGEFLQAYQSAWTPKNSFELDSETLELQQIKVDITWTAEQIYGFFKKWRPGIAQFGDSPLQNKFFTDYLVYAHIYPKILEEFNNIYFNGVFVPPTPGQPGVSINSIDGMKSRILSAHAAGRLNYIPIGVVTPANIGVKTKLFCDILPPQERDMEADIECSRQYMELFVQSVYGMASSVIDPRTIGFMDRFAIPFTNKTLVVNASMTKSKSMGLMFSSQQDNQILLLPETGLKESKQSDDLLPVLHWSAEKRELHGYGDMAVAIGFEFGAKMMVSDSIELNFN
jgi:hypothetical protein